MIDFFAGRVAMVRCDFLNVGPLCRRAAVAGGVFGLGFCFSRVEAAELSLVSGLYKNESSKIDGKSAGSASVIGAGGRYHDDMGDDYAWYGLGGFQLTSYSAADGRKSPSNGADLQVGGGMRKYFKPFTTGVAGFAAGDVFYGTSRDVEWSTTGYTESTSSGIMYEGILGLKVGLDSRFFAEFELPLFRNPLFVVTKKVTVVDSTGAETKQETTKTQLWADSFGTLMSIRVAVGMKL
jgi:hypothetical protein